MELTLPETEGILITTKTPFQQIKDIYKHNGNMIFRNCLRFSPLFFVVDDIRFQRGFRLK